jgi:2-polyprenyl-3-methyl-5-hydroxy-6-metoxy-1,4-benzoquinol methylase
MFPSRAFILLLQVLHLSVVSALEISHQVESRRWDPKPQAQTELKKTSTNAQNAGEYEYIVVGSGAGGGTLAARLALNGKKVLLIEAGDDQGENINQQVPVFHAFSTEDPSMSWDYYVKAS